MSRPISLTNLEARKKHSTSTLDFLWIRARNRTTGAPENVGFCSDEVGRSIYVRNPINGANELRAFYGAGGLVSISEIASTLSITVQTVEITMSQIDEVVARAIREYDPKMADVEIYIAQLDPNTNDPVDAAECRFFGYINNCEIIIPEEGGTGSVKITATSRTQEMVKSNPEKRSHESQLLRDPDDMFFVDAASVSTWVHYWGRESGHK